MRKKSFFAHKLQTFFFTVVVLIFDLVDIAIEVSFSHQARTFSLRSFDHFFFLYSGRMQFHDKYFLDDDDDDDVIDDACLKRFATPKDDFYISLKELPEPSILLYMYYNPGLQILM